MVLMYVSSYMCDTHVTVFPTSNSSPSRQVFIPINPMSSRFLGISRICLCSPFLVSFKLFQRLKFVNGEFDRRVMTTLVKH